MSSLFLCWRIFLDQSLIAGSELVDNRSLSAHPLTEVILSSGDMRIVT